MGVNLAAPNRRDLEAPVPAEPSTRWPRWSRSGLAYGGDYNPEQWPEDVWPQDVRLMREAGVNLVSVGIFSWALLEPEPGTYDFGWLDRVLDLLHGGGISVDLATASASPPPWFSRLHPESLPVDRAGTTLWPGGRQAFCPSSTAYRSAIVGLTEALATHYADHPALAMWHVHNEYGCHNAHCYCDASAAAFRRWLQARYGDIDVLNEAWGTSFWSQHYGDWDEIAPARLTGLSYVNPTQQLDFRRFSSDELLDCFRTERDVLHRITPGVPVTTNFMAPNFKELDYWAVGRRDGPGLQRPLPAGRAGRAARGPRAGRGPHAFAGVGRSVAAHGALDQRGQLAAAQLREGARRAAPEQPGAHRTRRRRGALLPVAGRQGRRREVPLRDASARRDRTPRSGARPSASEPTWRRWRRSPAAGSRPTSPSSSTGPPGGPPRGTRCPPTTSRTWTRCARCTRRTGGPG
jgi:hypothetical protein